MHSHAKRIEFIHYPISMMTPWYQNNFRITDFVRWIHWWSMDFPHKGTAVQSLTVISATCLNKLLNCRWFQTPWRPYLPHQSYGVTVKPRVHWWLVSHTRYLYIYMLACLHESTIITPENTCGCIHGNTYTEAYTKNCIIVQIHVYKRISTSTWHELFLIS